MGPVVRPDRAWTAISGNELIFQPFDNCFGISLPAGNRFDKSGESVDHDQKISEALHAVVCSHVSVVDGNVFEWGVWNREFSHGALVDRLGLWLLQTLHSAT